MKGAAELQWFPYVLGCYHLNSHIIVCVCDP